MSQDSNVYTEVRLIPSTTDQINKFKSCESDYLQGMTSRLDSYIEQMIYYSSTSNLSDNKDLLSAIKINFNDDDFEFNKNEAAAYLKAVDLNKRRDVSRLFEYLFYFLCFPVAKQIYFMQGGFHPPVPLFNQWLDIQPAIEQIYWYGEPTNSVIEDIQCKYCTGTFESFIVKDLNVNKMIRVTSLDYVGFLFNKYSKNSFSDDSRVIIQKAL